MIMEGRDEKGRFLPGRKPPVGRQINERIARGMQRAGAEEKVRKRSMKEWAQAYGEAKKKKTTDDGNVIEVTNDQEAVAVLYEIAQDKSNPAAAVRAAEALAKLKDEYSININVAEGDEIRPEIVF